MLAGCRIGQPVSFFDGDSGVEQAISQLRDRLGTPVRVLNLTIEPDQIVMRTQDPENRTRIDEWRFERLNLAFVNWERLSGPIPYQLTLANPDLEANLFELDEIDFTALPNLSRTAVARAGLAEPARVTAMEIARQVYLLPSPSSGEIRWTTDVNSRSESVQVFADARGAILGMNLDGTERARTLDILGHPDLAANAASAFRFVIGRDPMLTRVSIGARAMGFETNIEDPNAPVPVSGSLSARRIYTWNLNGLQRALAALNTDSVFDTYRLAFSIDDADWKALPTLIAEAKARLPIPDSRVTDIELARPNNTIGRPLLLWKVQVTGKNNESGYVLFDTAGNVQRVMLPQSLRKPADYYDPATLVATFTRLGADFGHDRQYAEIVVLGDKITFTAQDHMEPNVSRQYLLNENGYDRAGTPSMRTAKTVPFRIGDLDQLTAERLRELEARTLDTLKMPPKSIASITIGRGSMDPSPNGNVTIEIRAEEKPFGRAGRVNYELDGTVIATYLP